MIRGIACSAASSPSSTKRVPSAKAFSLPLGRWAKAGVIVITRAPAASETMRPAIMSIDRRITESAEGGDPFATTDSASACGVASPPSLTPTTTPAPISAATLTGTGLRTPPSTTRCPPIQSAG